MRKYTADNGTTYKIADEPPSLTLPEFYMIAVRNAKNPRIVDWENGLYNVTVRAYGSGFYIKNAAYVILGICNRNHTAHHDWREFQQIKNMLVDPEWVGLEQYPAESNLKDPSNQFYMWCVPKSIIGWGLPGDRSVLTLAQSIAPQRPFPEKS